MGYAKDKPYQTSRSAMPPSTTSGENLAPLRQLLEPFAISSDNEDGACPSRLFDHLPWNISETAELSRATEVHLPRQGQNLNENIAMKKTKATQDLVTDDKGKAEDVETSPFSQMKSALREMVDNNFGAGTVTRPCSLSTGHNHLPASTSSQITPLKPNEIPTRSLWLGNVDPTLTETDIHTAFSPFGEIESLRLLPAKECAFVNYYSAEDARRAREVMQGKPLGSMIVRVGFGKADHGLGSGNGIATSNTGIACNGNNEGNAGSVQSSRSLWVGQIGPDMLEETLCAAFSKFGPIESCRILEGKNCAFVNFYHLDHAIAARRAMNGARIGLATIRTGFAKSTNVPTGGAKSESSGEMLMIRGYHGQSYMTGDANMMQFAPLPYMQPMLAPTVEVGLGEFEGDLQTSIVELIKNSTVANVSTREIAQRKSSHHAHTTSLTSPTQIEPPVDFVEDEFMHPVPLAPSSPREILDIDVLRGYRKIVESSNAKEIEALTEEIAPELLQMTFDVNGNTLVQRMIEKGNDQVRTIIMSTLKSYLATLSTSKHGTWVVQKLISHAHTATHRTTLQAALRPHLVPLLHDAHGNYVVQACLTLAAKNQFVLDALYWRCLEIACNRFGSRAMRSCLESSHVTTRQRKYVAVAIVKHALTLVHDPNGVIALQWLLESELPGRFQHVAPMLKDHFASLCCSRAGSAIVARLIQTEEPAARQLVVNELYYREPSGLQALLQEPVAASILLKALTTAESLDEKRKLARMLKEPLERVANPETMLHLVRLCEVVKEVDQELQKEQEECGRKHRADLIQANEAARPIDLTKIGLEVNSNDENMMRSISSSITFGSFQSTSENSNPHLLASSKGIQPHQSEPQQQILPMTAEPLLFGPGIVQLRGGPANHDFLADNLFRDRFFASSNTDQHQPPKPQHS